MRVCFITRAFLEALAHKLALLSTVNPDNIVKSFGYYARRGDLSKGLKRLLEDTDADADESK